MLKRVVQFRGSDSLLGAERVILELAQQSPAFGYESVILALQHPTDPEPELVKLARGAGIRAEIIPCRGRFDRAVFTHIRNFMQAENINLLHCHGYKENFYGLFAGVNAPRVATNHLWKRESMALRLYCWLDSKLIKRFDQVVAVSKPIYEELLAVGVPQQRLRKISNGIDTLPFRQASNSDVGERMRLELGIAPERFVLGMLGSLTPEKGHIHALKALAQLRQRFPEMMLLIVGDGPLRETLQATAREMGISEHVRFFRHRNDVAAVLAVLDVFLLPSLIEGLPMALLEAMASGRAVVASAVGDVAAAVHDQQTGLLIPAGSARPLIAAVERLALDTRLRLRLGAAAADMIETRFSSHQMAHRYCELYDQLQPQPSLSTAHPRIADQR